MTRLAVTLLTNFVPPYLVPLFAALDARLERFRILVSTPMEPNRRWEPAARGLPVEVQRTLTLPQTWRHPGGFSEVLSLHVPLDTFACLRRSRPGVIVTTEFGLRTLQAIAYRALHRGTRVVLWALVSEISERGRGRLREALRRWMLRRADAVVVSGESGARYVGKLGFPRAAIFRAPYTTPVDAFGAATRAREGAAPARRRLLFVGQLVPRKGLAPFLSVLADWAASHPDEAVELSIVGDGPARSALERWPAPGNVALQLLGDVPYAELPAHYARADVLVFPTLADEWGVVVNEAMAAGVPVLGSLHSQAVEEMVEDGETGWTFRPDREGEMRAALERALAAPDAALERMRERCRSRVRAFTPESAARGMLAAIQHASERRPCPLCGGATSTWRRLPHTLAWRCRDRDCGLRFAGPQPDDAALREAYRTLYYPGAGGRGSACEDTPDANLRELIETAIERLGRAEGARLLDFGCGRGGLCRVARRRGLDTAGIESDPAARAAATASGLRTYTSLPELRRAEPAVRFDLVTLWQVLEHLREPWVDLAALGRMLAPGGLLLIATPNAVGLRARLLGARWENAANPTHLYYFTETSLRRMIRASGLVAIDRLHLPAVYSHHGVARRLLQRLLRARRLDGDVALVAARPRGDARGRWGE